MICSFERNWPVGKVWFEICHSPDRFPATQFDPVSVRDLLRKYVRIGLNLQRKARSDGLIQISLSSTVELPWEIFWLVLIGITHLRASFQDILTPRRGGGGDGVLERLLSTEKLPTKKGYFSDSWWKVCLLDWHYFLHLVLPHNQIEINFNINFFLVCIIIGTWSTNVRRSIGNWPLKARGT